MKSFFIIILAALVIIFLIRLYFFIAPVKRSLRENISPKTGKFIRILLVIGVVVLAWFIYRNLQGAGQGLLLAEHTQADVASMSEETDEEIKETDEDGLVISVATDGIYVNDTLVAEESLGSTICDRLKGSPDISIELWDDYARKDTYLKVKDILSDIGIAADRIHEHTGS